jgi:hypothetical protein
MHPSLGAILHQRGHDIILASITDIFGPPDGAYSATRYCWRWAPEPSARVPPDRRVNEA